MLCQAVSRCCVNENQRVAQLLHLVWGAARLFQVLLNENQRVPQLLHLLWCVARLLQMLVNESQRVAQLLLQGSFLIFLYIRINV